METLTITKNQLRAVLLRWAQDFRDGKTRSHEETDALPEEQTADESTTYLWHELGGTKAEPAAALALTQPKSTP